MGYLSDTAVFNHLVDCTFLAAFFEKGLRANNTTVNAAMEFGCAVITNLDEHSPKGLVHMKNVIDINRCDRLPERRRAEEIGRAAREIAHAQYGGTSWSRSCALGRGGVAIGRPRRSRETDSGRDIQNRHARDRRLTPRAT